MSEPQQHHWTDEEIAAAAQAMKEADPALHGLATSFSGEQSPSPWFLASAGYLTAKRSE